MGGFFISIEGADGAGKSTQVRLLSEYFEKHLIKTVVTREPGGTAIGEQIRNIIIDARNSEMEAVTEIFLYLAARAQVVRERILPALDSGAVVICDRFADSTFAYQCYARGLDYELAEQINAYATGGLSPDITFFLDLPPDESLLRVKNGALPDRLELEGLNFQKKVYLGYKKLAENNPRILTINANGKPEEIHREIIKNITFGGNLNEACHGDNT